MKTDTRPRSVVITIDVRAYNDDESYEVEYRRCHEITSLDDDVIAYASRSAPKIAKQMLAIIAKDADR